jgi:predicted esterase
MNVRDFSEMLFQLHEQGRYADALAFVDLEGGAFPQRAGMLVRWRASLLCRIGRSAEAIRELQVGVGAGFWWEPWRLTNDPDLEPIRGLPEFAEILRESEERFHAARRAATPGVRVFRPDVEPIKVPPLVIALSWRGRALDDFADWWKPVTELGAVLAVPRSSQLTGMNAFGWDDLQLAEAEIEACFASLRANERFDPERIVLTGASQGAALAIRLSLAGAIVPACGFIAVVPGFTDTQPFHDLADAGSVRRIRGRIVAGELDLGRDLAIELYHGLRERGADCRIDVVAGLEHDFPPDFESRLPDLLSSVLA